MKNVIIITSSPRKGGNSDTLANEFANGAKAAGNSVEIIAVKDVKLQFCIGCMYCQTHDKCVLDDKMNTLYSRIQHADVLVFATPVYYYSISGQLKTFLDRLNPLFPRNNSFKEVYLLATSADNDVHAMDGSVSDINGWISCFDGVELKGVLRGVGVSEKGDVLNTDFPAKAYEMGYNI